MGKRRGDDDPEVARSVLGDMVLLIWVPKGSLDEVEKVFKDTMDQLGVVFAVCPVPVTRGQLVDGFYHCNRQVRDVVVARVMDGFHSLTDFLVANNFRAQKHG